MSKLFLYDTETTGLLHYKNAIHQLSGLIVINDRITEEFNFQIKPHPEAVIEESALLVSNVTKEQIMEYPEPYIVHNKLLNLLSKYCNKYNKLDKFFLVGFNNKGFDDEFFRNFFNLLDDKYFASWFWWDTIDVRVLAANYLMEERHKMPDFKLRTVAQYLGIEVDETKLHDAIYDMRLTKSIYDIVGNNKITAL